MTPTFKVLLALKNLQKKIVNINILEFLKKLGVGAFMLIEEIKLWQTSNGKWILLDIKIEIISELVF